MLLMAKERRKKKQAGQPFAEGRERQRGERWQGPSKIQIEGVIVKVVKDKFPPQKYPDPALGARGQRNVFPAARRRPQIFTSPLILRTVTVE